MMISSCTLVLGACGLSSFLALRSDFFTGLAHPLLLFISIGRLIINAAKARQALPQLSLILLFHSCLHFFYVIPNTSLSEHYKQMSFVLLIICGTINMIGYVSLIALYRHSIQTIFNREIPPTLNECLPSFGAHLSLLRPLQIVWRYYTSSWRVLPDIIVLGEVRCGTTSFCQQLANLKNFDCQTPFCLWAHPELDNKETFFFVGHYLGNVTPRHYRMCFPLKITRWFNRMSDRIRGLPLKPFLTFDGCAQYLSSPSAPYLIAQAYREAGQPPPVLIACVRNPADQALSWWDYEKNAMKWSEGMGLTKWNTKLRGPDYPPKSLKDALRFSQSTPVQNSYWRAEQLVQTLKKDQNFKLPPWAMTWPCGQLSVIGRNSKFVENIERYERIFGERFDSNNVEKTNTDDKTSSFRYVDVLPLEYLGNDTLLKNFLLQILKQVGKRRHDDFQAPLQKFESCRSTLTTVHRNSGSSKRTSKELLAVQPLFEQDQDKLNKMLKEYNITVNSTAS